MQKYSTPEACGISSAAIEKYVRRLNENGFAMHSIMMSRGDSIFLEGYWKPFTSKTHHRLNSITKTFVGTAVLLLIEDGRLSFDDKIISFFPDYDIKKIPDYAKELTVRDLMTMRTTTSFGGHWVYDRVTDRMPLFLYSKAQRPHDTLFRYDSTGSFVLGVIVERITGTAFTDYLMNRLLKKIGFSSKTECIKGPDGYSWGDSGLLVRMCDLHKLAKLFMDKGMYEGEQLMRRDLLELAVSRISDTMLKGHKAYNTFGYGMQIWKSYEDGFMFSGMGDQLVVCIPKKQFIFICTADNQENQGSRPIILDVLYHDIIKQLSDAPLPEAPEKAAHLNEYLSNMELVHLKSEVRENAAEKISSVTYTLGDNPMKIDYLRLDFDGDSGKMTYKNQTGEKVLLFGIDRNIITEFPEEGYPDMQMNVPAPGNKYPCAVSAAWREERLLCIRVQMIGKHLGGLYIMLGFTPDYREIGVYMFKNTRCFLDTYNGYAGGTRED